MIYVMSDIHGNMRRFNSIMEQIKLKPEDTLYILGDVIDRYPDGIKILRKIMAMPNAKMLLGNHEFMMLQSLGEAYDDYPFFDGDPANRFRRWYANGGEVTHIYWKRIRKNLREEIAAYLKSLPLNYDITVNNIPYKLVHGAPLDAYETFAEFFRNEAHFAVWKRWRVFDQLPCGYILVFGHTPTDHYQPNNPMEIWKYRHLIGIDCGGGYPEDAEDEYCCRGRLACLRLDDMQVFYSEESFYKMGREPK